MPAMLEIKRGYQVECIKCGNDEGVHVQVGDTAAFRCTNCDEEFNAAEIREHIERWEKLLAWCESAPMIG